MFAVGWLVETMTHSVAQEGLKLLAIRLDRLSAGIAGVSLRAALDMFFFFSIYWELEVQ